MGNDRNEQVQDAKASRTRWSVGSDWVPICVSEAGDLKKLFIFDTQHVDDTQMTSCGKSINSCLFLLRDLWKVQPVTELECRQDRVYDTVQGSERSLGM